MKTTGMTRRIDELGRVVIPKEIRRSLRLGVGEEVELFVENGALLLKKYSALYERRSHAYTLSRMLRERVRASVLITDTDKVIAAACESLCDYDGKVISSELSEVLRKRERLVMKGCALPLLQNDCVKASSLVVLPVCERGDLFGGLVAFKTEGDFEEHDLKILEFSVDYFSASDF